MKILFLSFALALAVFQGTAIARGNDVHVNGYYRSNGTYVQPHVRTAPDHTPTNNYSYPGNTNPYTGQTAGGSTSWGMSNHSSNLGGVNSLSSPSRGHRGW